MEIVTAGFIEFSVLKLRAHVYAQQLKRQLKDPRTDPDIIEDDIKWKVAVNDAKYDLSYDQCTELLELLSKESGLDAIKADRMRRLERKVG